jgi:hypothetical protein
MIIQQFKLSTTILVFLTAVSLCALLAIRYVISSSAVEPRVTLGAASPLIPIKHRGAAPQTDIVSVMENEPSRTAARTGEATALAFSASLYAAAEQLKGRTPRTVRDLIAGVAGAGLLPPGLSLTEKEGAIVSTQGTLWIRYRPTPLAIEVVSLAGDGPALLVRLPEDAAQEGEARLYLATNLKILRVPGPFAPAAEVIALGWSPETLRSLR